MAHACFSKKQSNNGNATTNPPGAFRSYLSLYNEMSQLRRSVVQYTIWYSRKKKEEKTLDAERLKVCSSNYYKLKR